MDRVLNAEMRRAAAAGDVEAVRSLLEQGAEVDAFGLGGYTALMDAAAQGELEVVRLLVERGAEVARRDLEYGGTAFTEAVGGKHVGTARFLLEAGADISQDLPRLLAPALEQGDAELIRMLLALGIDLNGFESATGWTALMEACHYGHAETAGLLLGAGADPNAKRWPWTALRLAARGGHSDVCRLLVEHGAEVDLVSAAQAGLPDLVQTCIAEGTDVNAVDESGLTPLMGAVLGDHVEIAQLIIDHGADLQLKHVHGMSALAVAKQHGSREMVELLEKAGATI